MKANDIREAVDAGKTVHWQNDGYTVIQANGEYLIKFAPNGHCIGLTWQDGQTLNGAESEFYIALSAAEEYKAKKAKRKAKQFSINPDTDGLRWIENVSAGWRFVGYADEIAGLRHTGYYTDEFGDNIMRGVVYRLPSRKGLAVFAVGYADPNNEDAARLEIFTTDIGDDNGQDAEREAAREADRIAERCAEKEREYQECWQLGNEFAQTLEHIQAGRAEQRQLLAELKTAKAAGLEYPTICQSVRASLNSSRASVRAAIKRRRDIVEDHYIRSAELLAAFADGADITMDEAKAIF